MDAVVPSLLTITIQVHPRPFLLTIGSAIWEDQWRPLQPSGIPGGRPRKRGLFQRSGSEIGMMKRLKRQPPITVRKSPIGWDFCPLTNLCSMTGWGVREVPSYNQISSERHPARKWFAKPRSLRTVFDFCSGDWESIHEKSRDLYEKAAEPQAVSSVLHRV
jgi:hypothetical protein